MTFLNPAILFGLIAASIPIVLHFLNLRKLKKIEFSTLQFLKELQKTKIRRIKIKQWLLLLLRILIIISIVIAFARPTIKNASFGYSSAKTTAVIILDNTFSMSIVSGDGSYFNRAKQTAKSLLNFFGDGDDVAIIFAGQENEAGKNPLSNLAAVKKQIDDAEISFRSAALDESIIEAGKILYGSKNFNKELYILTDLQSGRINTAGIIENELSALFNNIKIYLIDFHEKEPINIGIDEFKLNSRILERDKPLDFSALITNYSNRAVNNSVASLILNGKRSAQQNISIEPGRTAKVNFETTLNDTGFVEASVELEDDDINQDNRRYFGFYIPAKINLLVLYNSRDDYKFVNLALTNAGAQYDITESTLSQISSFNLYKYNAVIQIGSEYNGKLDNLKDYVESGGGFIFMPGSTSTADSIQNIFSNLGINSNFTFIGKPNSTDISARFLKTDFESPLLAEIFIDEPNKKIDSPDIYYYARINPGAAGNSIITMFDNSAFLSEYKIGLGRMLAFNSAPVPGHSTFPLKSIFAPLINRTILYSASALNEGGNILAGENLTANIRNASGQQIKVNIPGGLFEFVNTDSLLNKNFLTYTKTNTTGVYKFYGGNKLIDFAAVNCDPKESVVKYESASVLENYLRGIGFEGAFYNISPGDDVSKAVYESRFGTELWKYFLILSLILAIAEMIISKSSKKDLSNLRQ